jgi:hypothetical protein
LSRTLVTPTSSTVFTWSAWIKRGALTGTYRLFGASTTTFLTFNSSDQLNLTLNGTSAATSTAVFRDPSAWYHVVYTQNGASQTLYVNQASVATGTTSNTVFNTAIAHQLGAANTTNFFDGYLTEVNFIDGQALTPSSFGQIESTTGVWQPKPYIGTYGANGFYLKFADNSAAAAVAIGKDSSGNGNNWTPSGISVTAGATYDSMIDVPVSYNDSGNGRGNYCILNPLEAGNSSITLSEANLRFVHANATSQISRGTTAVSSGKWYWEALVGASGDLGVGIIDSANQSNAFAPGIWVYGAVVTSSWKNNGFVNYGATFASGDIIGVALDLDASTLTFYKNNVSQGVFETSIGSRTVQPAVARVGGTTPSCQINFGQRPFTYTPPSGFRALNTNNLPTPTIVNGANFMAATTYTGNGAIRSISNLSNGGSFQPNLVWIKSRTPAASNNVLFDSTRGAINFLSSNTALAQTTNNTTLTAFTSDGFSLSTDTTLVNASGNSYIAWQWRAGSGTASNTSGSITSQVNANTVDGFSVVTYTGTGANATVGHGLGIAPSLILVKRYSVGTNTDWQVRHVSIAAANSMQLNSTAAAASAATVWNSTAPTSSVFSIGTSGDVNTSAISYVAYCFAEIAGFSKFGSYTGNGSASGPFVFCGFRPRFVLIKNSTNGVSPWLMYDSSRDVSNVEAAQLQSNSANTEVSVAFCDFTANGFKIRQTGTSYNETGQTYIFAAFAEVPSKYALAR